MSLYTEASIKLRLIITMILLGSLMFFCNVFAAPPVAKFDCQQAVSMVDNETKLSAFDKVFNNIYPREDINEAAKHLMYYCCEKGFLGDTSCKGVPEVLPGDLLYAESPYLYDHLVDVGFRRLDGNETSQYPAAGLDAAGKKRRDDIRSYAKAVNGVIPRIILEQYDLAWNISQDLPYSPHGKPDLETLNKNRSSYGLKNKYFTMCFVSQYINQDFISIHTNKKHDSIGTTNIYKACMGRANKVIQDEFNYVKFVMIQQGANLIAHNMDGYLDGYFVRGRMQEMLTKFSKMQAMFATVVQKVNEGTRNCSGG